LTTPVRQQSASTFHVEIGGTALPDDIHARMSYALVEDNLNLPDMFVLSFLDPDHGVIAKAGVKVGAAVKISVQSEANASGEPLLSGEVTAIETEFEGGKTHTIVRGFDKANRLYRGRRTRAFKDVKYSDVVKEVAQAAGLDIGEVESPPGQPVRHLAQANTTDAAFLAMLAGEVGFVLAVADGKVNFQAPTKATSAPGEGDLSTGDPLQLIQGDNLLRFNATITSDSQVKDVSVRGWDVKTKQAVVGTAPNTTTSAQVGVTCAELAEAFGDRTFTATDVPYGSTEQVDAAAKALAEQIAGSHAQLEGVARGNPKLRAGQAVSLGLVGEPFEGKYTLTVTRHVFDNGEYLTHFASTGRQERSLQSMTSGGGAAVSSVSPAFVTSPIAGVVSAIVTNVKDDDGIGQAKVKIPRLDEQFESDWMRVVQPGAGDGRGGIFLPEVDDEVLVAFEQGDVRRGYVLGGVYNGVHKPSPPAHDGAVGSDGKVAKRSFTSRKGHFLLFSDQDGDEYVEVATKDQKFSIKAAQDQDGGVVLVTSNGKVTVNAQGDITISGKAKIAIEATGELSIKGQKVSIEAQSALEMKGVNVSLEGSAQTEVKGAQTKVAGSAMLDLDGGAMANLHAATGLMYEPVTNVLRGTNDPRNLLFAFYTIPDEV
jgi:phage protein D/phage baseplate assembly protein gpV